MLNIIDINIPFDIMLAPLVYIKESEELFS